MSPTHTFAIFYRTKTLQWVAYILWNWIVKKLAHKYLKWRDFIIHSSVVNFICNVNISTPNITQFLYTDVEVLINYDDLMLRDRKSEVWPPWHSYSNILYYCIVLYYYYCTKTYNASCYGLNTTVKHNHMEINRKQ
jgi:hypothetical protein